MTVEIRALQPSDERESFRSGDEALDLYFHRYAGQNQFRHHLGVTYIALERSTILGFVTVSPGQLDADALPSRKRRPPYPVPVLRVARLATGEAHRGRGVGKALLRFAIELAEKMREELGCVGLVVDAKPAADGFYEALGFVAIGLIEGASAEVPRPTPMFIALSSVPPARR
ncbi:MAG: GNAT family N-acetyltransferase [Deltaproteobacteria bacterium]